MKSFTLSHILDVLSQESFPVVGNSTSALIFALLFTVVVFILYLIVDHIPKPRKNIITPKNEPTYVKATLTLVVFAMMSAGWDIWWHRAIGRDNFWVMPHIFLYSFIVASMVVVYYVWRHCRDLVWKHIFFLLLLIPVAGAFDNYFHTLWGVEDFSRPLYLSWSPSHVLLNLSVLGILILILKLLVRFRKTPDFSFFGNLSFAAIYSLLLFLALPFYPTGPWGQIIGFAGAGVITFLYVFISLAAERVMKGRIDATMTSLFILLFAMITYGSETAPHIFIMPHDRPPIWLIVFAFTFTGFLLDLSKNRFPIWVRGMFAGMFWSTVLLGFSPIFFAQEFQYGLIEIFTAVTFSAMGGLVAGSIFGIFHLDDETHLQKMLKKW